jgi:hypothetical protein
MSLMALVNRAYRRFVCVTCLTVRCHEGSHCREAGAIRAHSTLADKERETNIDRVPLVTPSPAGWAAFAAGLVTALPAP